MEIIDQQPEKNYEKRPQHFPAAGIVFGLMLITIGLVYTSYHAGWMSYEWRHVIISWQMLLIAIGLVSLAKRQITQGIILCAIGFFFILPRIASLAGFYGFDWISGLGWHTIWPVALIIVGILIFARARSGKPCGNTFDKEHGRNGRHTSYHNSGNGYVRISHVFSGSDQVFLDPYFKGGSIETVFGGMSLDLRRTDLNEGSTYLKISTVFGGVTIYVPEDWYVEIRSDSVFGAFNDKRAYPVNNKDNNKRLIIEAECVFGGGEVK